LKFYVGIHHLSLAKHLGPVFVSASQLEFRKSPFTEADWIMDSGAFTTLVKHGGYPHAPQRYAALIKRFAQPNLVAAVTQDFMCEPFMLARTGLTVADHQRLTIERTDDLMRLDTGGIPIMPVLQGYAPSDYVEHLRQYGTRLAHGAYVGVGSVCKRNGKPDAIVSVLEAIKRERPDLRLHGFGLKVTSLAYRQIRDLLFSADSMAWSYAARRQGRDRNSWREAKAFTDRIINDPLSPKSIQLGFDL
jgi:hypothetical protein